MEENKKDGIVLHLEIDAGVAKERISTDLEKYKVAMSYLEKLTDTVITAITSITEAQKVQAEARRLDAQVRLASLETTKSKKSSN